MENVQLITDIKEITEFISFPLGLIFIFILIAAIFLSYSKFGEEYQFPTLALLGLVIVFVVTFIYQDTAIGEKYELTETKEITYKEIKAEDLDTKYYFIYPQTLLLETQNITNLREKVFYSHKNLNRNNVYKDTLQDYLDKDDSIILQEVYEIKNKNLYSILLQTPTKIVIYTVK